ncbi:TadE/TadG family type IV pilus assembly protein [Photobacterium sp. MCCC 1A19761]|uniref:TadE/TadG family type IV pilus assembly protein n=1 Tax=Photobacterium sp. MCCC 1A19761 TaxID=3115000 RepID=UPI00307EEE18
MNHQPQKQSGVTIVEFTIIASLFFLLIFSIIEFGRLMFTWHTLNETSRRVARLASVCQITATEQADALNAAIIDSVPLPNFSANNIQVKYLDSDGGEVSEPLTDPSNHMKIEFVEASIINYNLELLIPLATFGVKFTAPEFKTILPRESLGVTRTGFTDC